MLFHSYIFTCLLLTASLGVADQSNYEGVWLRPSNQQPVVATVLQQACGIPDGDSSYLTNVQQQVGSRYRRSDQDENAPVLEPRIIGGTEVPSGPASLCWEVSVLTKTANYSYTCAGTIVGSRTILTAGICALYPALETGLLPFYGTAKRTELNLTSNPMIVATGVLTTASVVRKTGQAYPQEIAGCAKNYTVVKAVFRDYDISTGNNGVVILILSEPIDFRANGGCACKLCLSQKNASVGDTCIVSGWGKDAEGNASSQPAFPFRYVKQKIQPLSSDPNVCYQTDLNITAVIPLDRFYCAGGIANETWCGGDDGAPLTCYDPNAKVQYLAGIAEYRDVCGGSAVATRYTKVSLYLRWIFDNAPLGDVSFLN